MKYVFFIFIWCFFSISVKAQQVEKVSQDSQNCTTQRLIIDDSSLQRKRSNLWFLMHPKDWHHRWHSERYFTKHKIFIRSLK